MIQGFFGEAQAYKPCYRRELYSSKRNSKHITPIRFLYVSKQKVYGHAVKNEDDISKFYTPALLKAMLEVPRSAVRAYKTAFVYVQK